MSATDHRTAFTIRGVDISTKEKLKERAKQHGRSMEAEVRHILESSVRPVSAGLEFQELSQRLGGLDDLSLIMDEHVADRRGKKA